MNQVFKNGIYFISTDKNHLDFSFIFGFLHFKSYWARGIPRETFEKSIDNAVLCYGLFEGNPSTGQAKQIGFARVISDLATFAYLADVFIAEEYRGLGLAKWLLQAIINHSELQGLRRIMLATKDAHGLYEKFGFKPLEDERIFLEKGILSYNP